MIHGASPVSELFRKFSNSTAANVNTDLIFAMLGRFAANRIFGFL